VESVNNSSAGQAKFDEEVTSVNISQRVDLSSQINGERPRLQVDIAGIDQALEKLNDFLDDFHHGFLFNDGDRSCAALVHGSAGTGKTHVLNKVIETGWGKVHRIKRGIKPAAIPAIFKDAKLTQPSIIVIDDIEKLVSKDDSISESIADIIGEELDNLVQGCTTSIPNVLVVAATTDLSKIPDSLKKSGRFTTDILLPIPDAAARKAILRSKSPKINPDIIDETIEKLGDRTHAYTPEDLTKLLHRAIRLAEKRLRRITEAKKIFLEQDDIEQALLLVRPTAMHDITLQPPKVKWDEIGGQENVKQALRDAVETPLTVNHPFQGGHSHTDILIASRNNGVPGRVPKERPSPLRSTRLFKNPQRPSYGHGSWFQFFRCQRRRAPRYVRWAVRKGNPRDFRTSPSCKSKYHFLR
jgi:AAA family ATPase